MTDDQQPVEGAGIGKREPTTKEGQSSQNQLAVNRRAVLKAAGIAGAGLTGLGAISGSAAAAVGDELGTVTLPGHESTLDPFFCGVGGAFDGKHYVVPKDGDGDCASSVIQIYDPPSGGDGQATLVSEKNIVDSTGDDVNITTNAWDPSREQFWVTGGENAALLDLGDRADGSVDAVATSQFSVESEIVVDGLGYDGANDALYYSGDVSEEVLHYDIASGTQTDRSPIVPKDANGDTIGEISGVATGATRNGRPTLYVGQNPGPDNGNIFRVYADDGEFIAEFQTGTGFRVEDITCDPVNYEHEGILVKDARDSRYKAFQVEAGTCPIGGGGCDPSVSVDLIADGGSESTAVTIGTVTVTSLDADDDDASELSVTYSLEDDWFLRETHLHVAGDNDEDGDGDCDRIPQAGNGNPKVGHFGLSRDYGSGVQEDTYVIERAAGDNVFGEELSEGEGLCLAAHAAVFQDKNDNETFDPDVDREETAWGKGKRFTQRGNWAMHFGYQNPCIDNPFASE